MLPDEVSRLKIQEKDSNEITERYQGHIHLGYLEWKKQYNELKSQKTPILFIMTTNTKEADQIAEYLETNYPEFKDAVLTIHTNKNGEIQNKEDIEKLRKAADEIDSEFSSY